MAVVKGVLAKLPTRESLVAGIQRVPAVRGAASPFVAGETVESAVSVAQDVQGAGMAVSVLQLDDDLQDGPPARADYLGTIEAFADADLADGSDLLVDLAALGLAAGADRSAMDADLSDIVAAAEQVGMTVTLAGLAHDHLGTGLAVHRDVLADHRDLGATVAADMLRSEADCADLARLGARVRLVRHEGRAPAGLCFGTGHEVGMSYVRCTRALMSGGARVTIATHDPRLLEIATALAVRNDLDTSGYDLQLPLGVRPEVAAELVAAGSRVSIVVPFGPGWSAYLTQRIGLTPDVLGQAARGVIGR